MATYTIESIRRKDNYSITIANRERDLINETQPHAAFWRGLDEAITNAASAWTAITMAEPEANLVFRDKPFDFAEEGDVARLRGFLQDLRSL